MPGPNQFVELWYPCIGDAENQQIALGLVYQVIGDIFVPADQSDLLWTLAGAAPGSPRFNAWQQISGYSEILVPVGENEFERFYVYPANPWQGLLNTIRDLPAGTTCYLRPIFLQ